MKQFMLFSVTYQPIAEVEERLYFSTSPELPPFEFIREVATDELKGTHKHGPCGPDGMPAHPAGYIFRDEISFKRNL